MSMFLGGCVGLVLGVVILLAVDWWRRRQCGRRLEAEVTWIGDLTDEPRKARWYLTDIDPSPREDHWENLRKMGTTGWKSDDDGEVPPLTADRLNALMDETAAAAHHPSDRYVVDPRSRWCPHCQSIY